MSAPEHWTTIPDIVDAARVAMALPLWEYSGSGSETEVTVRRNRAVFDHFALMPRHLHRLGNRSTATTFLKHELSLPVMLAPVGLIQMFSSEGAVPPARAAARAGTISFVGTNSEPSLEEVRAAASGPTVFQLYTYGDRPWVERLVRRVENAGYDALCLTVDCPDFGLRDRYHARGTESTRLDGSRPNVEPMQGASGRIVEQKFLGEFDWDDLEWLRATTRLPLIVKGILSAEEASHAVDLGVDVIHVSNHGGRRQDQLPATLEVLPSVLAAVDGRSEVIVDSGFMRGTDIVKALAMGARTVLVGKLMIWALAAGGEEGIVRMLEILHREIEATMANIGAGCLADLTPEMVVPSLAPPEAPWPVVPMHYREL